MEDNFQRRRPQLDFVWYFENERWSLFPWAIPGFTDIPGSPSLPCPDLLGPMMIVTIPKVVSAPEKFQKITLLQDTVYPPLDGKIERGYFPLLIYFALCLVHNTVEIHGILFILYFLLLYFSARRGSFIILKNAKTDPPSLYKLKSLYFVNQLNRHCSWLLAPCLTAP